MNRYKNSPVLAGFMIVFGALSAVAGLVSVLSGLLPGLLIFALLAGLWIFVAWLSHGHAWVLHDEALVYATRFRTKILPWQDIEAVRWVFALTATNPELNPPRNAEIVMRDGTRHWVNLPWGRFHKYVQPLMREVDARWKAQGHPKKRGEA